MLAAGLHLLERLETYLDNPSIPWKTLVIGFTIGQFGLEQFLAARQYKKLQQKQLPKLLDGIVDKETFTKSQSYGRAKAQFGFFSSLYGLATNLVILKYDLLPQVWDLSGRLAARIAPAVVAGPIFHAICFVMTFVQISTLLNLPLSLYSTFVLEEKFGFNKQTLRLFITDLIKGQVLTVAIGSPVLWAFLKIVNHFGRSFFFYLWVFFLAFQALMITVYPIFIQPLFNKLEPLPEGKLRTEIEKLAGSLHFPLKHLYVIDGSKRSAHSNAYFFGLPWSKHIVLFDTLIEQSSQEEIVAVLAHELGHWQLSHTSRILAISQIHIFCLFALFSCFITNGSVYRSFGFTKGVMPIVVGFILYGDILTPLDSVLTLGMNMLSRKHEYEADAFAKELGYDHELGEALVKLQVKNLSTMDPDAWFSAYHHSHPTLTERLRAISWQKGSKKGQ
ncbi:CAAX prenyl protease 1 [Protomyces lactucae-debilis]|uniref:CAAX prenyl protease n=1 Tax=Protomyces lactucae-debilis TaxID=2754530 RepID=A0A1Y2F7F7_PROLT|nr:CAAX prenyl protease 1 [Protomyces lactucae-debilis]ORY79860.1 CAAX prenyl protease 1 [Protomyces lactucae-debilis]